MKQIKVVIMAVPFIRNVLVPGWILVFGLVVLGAPPLEVTASALLVVTAVLIMSGLLPMPSQPVRASMRSTSRAPQEHRHTTSHL
jgi:hypothetical protein